MTTNELPLDNLTPSRLWASLDLDTRRLAAKSLFSPDWDDDGARAEAVRSIATTLRYREVAVRRMPADKRADYLARIVRPDDSLATAMLMALHFLHRKALLGAFLDRLGIPQQDGVIDADHELESFPARRLREAADAVRREFPRDQVDVYLASLLAIDPDSWGNLDEFLRATAD